jgi:hypothetical protein
MLESHAIPIQMALVLIRLIPPCSPLARSQVKPFTLQKMSQDYHPLQRNQMLKVQRSFEQR